MSKELMFWSEFMFWFIAINVVLTFLFAVAVVIGGIFDLRYLFNSLKEQVADETDDGRVIKKTSESIC